MLELEKRWIDAKHVGEGQMRGNNMVSSDLGLAGAWGFLEYGWGGAGGETGRGVHQVKGGWGNSPNCA